MNQIDYMQSLIPHLPQGAYFKQTQAGMVVQYTQASDPATETYLDDEGVEQVRDLPWVDGEQEDIYSFGRNLGLV